MFNVEHREDKVSFLLPTFSWNITHFKTDCRFLTFRETRNDLCEMLKKGAKNLMLADFSSRQGSGTSVQFSLVAQSCPTLCDPMNRSTPGIFIHHQLPEFTQTHVHRVSDAIQPSHPVVPFTSCPQSLPASESFPMSQLFP